MWPPLPPHKYTLGTWRIDQEVLELSMQRITAATSCDHKGNEKGGKREEEEEEEV